MWRIRVTAAETGAAEGVERMVPLGSEMDIAIRYCCVICLVRDVCLVAWRAMCVRVATSDCEV